MMKSFFKKLAFVMALAMVVSMAAPAGSALAAGLSVAYQAGGAVSELNLKAGAEQDLKFLGAPKNWKDLGWSWTSSNEAVATVDAAGVVTAVADGTATITITVGSLSGSVTVNVGEAKAYDVTLGNADNKAMTTAELKKGANLDLNFYGVKDWNKNNYTVAWSVSGDAANVDKNGVVTAVKAGKAVVTASIVNNVTGVAHKVTPVEVTVAADVNKDAFTVAQKDTDKFVLTFNEAKTADAIRDGLTVSVKIGDKDYPISFENIAVDGNKVTVTTYAQFENDEVYSLAYANEKVEFTTVIGEITNVGVNYYTGKNKDNNVAYVAEEEENDYVTLVPVLYDQYGNDITAKFNLAEFDFYYEVSNNVKPVAVFNDVFAFDAAGLATVNITATWINDAGELKETTGKTTFVVEKHGKIGFTLEKAGIANLNNDLQDDNIFAVLTGTDSKYTSFRMDPKSPIWDKWGGYFATTNLTFDSKETWSSFVYTAVFKDNRGNLVTSNNDMYLHGTFSYESTNNDVLSIADGTGSVTVYKPGKANILVYFTPADGSGSKKLVASTPIVIAPEPYPVTFKVLDASLTTASDVVTESRDGGLNDVTFRVQFYDQNGNVYTKNTDILKDLIVVEARDSENRVTYKGDITWGNDWADTWYKVTFDGSHFNLGDNVYKQYGYKVSLEEHDLVSTVKTPYTVFNLTVRDTSEECTTLRTFIDSTAGGTQAGYVDKTNYKFNIVFGGNGSTNVAVGNITGYSPKWATGHIKDNGISARYQSTGGLNIANIPAFLLKDTTDQRVTTGHVGYVYYKISAPSKVTVAGDTNVKNTAWKPSVADGKVKFTFNSNKKTVVDKYNFRYEDGTVVAAVLNKDGQNFDWAQADSFFVDGYCVYINEAAGTWDRPTAGACKEGKQYWIDQGENQPRAKIWLDEIVTKEVDDNLKYAGNGSYNVSFSTTRKEGSNLGVIKTSAITVSNSQSEMKYLGLNPDYAGVTENFDFVEGATLSASTLEALANEQLLLSYEDLLLGEYYESTNIWDIAAKNGWTVCGSDIVVNTAASKYTCSDDSIIITKLAFDVKLDDGKTNTSHIYTTVVNVGVRIKEK